MASSKIKQTIADSLKNVMLRTSIWGVLDITYMERKYLIIETVKELISSDYFKVLGFNVELIDHDNFVRKIPYFDNNDEFIEKHDLKFNGTKSYQAYLTHMYHDKIKHENET